jgi:hypothetical protein
MATNKDVAKPVKEPRVAKSVNEQHVVSAKRKRSEPEGDRVRARPFLREKRWCVSPRKLILWAL